MTQRALEFRLTRRHLMIAAAALAVAGEAGRVTAQGHEVTPAAIEPKDEYTFIVGGLDTRTVEEPENTDVLMVSRLNLTAGTVRTLSFARDLYLEIPGVGLDKINRAYDWGSKANDHDWNAGVALMSQMFEYNFGIEIDAVLTTNFKGMPKVVDALGGIEVVNPYDLRDDLYPTEDYGTKEIFYPAGPLHLEGEQALEFSRTRHQDGDDGRVMRQQLVLSALLEKAQEPVNADQLAEIVEATREGVTTNIPQAVQEQLVEAVPAIAPENVIWGTITDYLWGDTAAGMWVYQADWSVLPGFVQGWLAGE